MSDWTQAATDMTTRLKRSSAAMTIYDEVGHDGVRRWSFYVGRSDAPIMWAGPYLSESDVLEAALLWKRGRP